MLAIPLVLGLAVVARPGAAPLLLVPAMTFLFLSRYAALPAAVRLAQGKAVPPGVVAHRFLWTAVYLGTSLACLVAALSLVPPGAFAVTLLVGAATTILGAAQTLLVFLGRGRSIGGEFLGMTALASAAPLVVAASGRSVDGRAIGAGLTALIYFVSGLAFVRAYRAVVKGRGGAVSTCVLAHAVLGGLILLLWSAGWMPAGTLLAFSPLFARTAWGLLVPPRTLRILGWREVAVAILFTGGAVAALLT
jgi:hypothetical protein